MRNPGGYSFVCTPVETVADFDKVTKETIDPGTFERDTFTCKHCNRVTHVKPRMDAASLGGLCKICYGLICPFCVGKGCDPFEAKLERQEARQLALRSYGL